MRAIKPCERKPEKMPNAELTEAVTKLPAAAASKDNYINQLQSQLKSQARLALSDMEVILFHKKADAKEKAPDLNGELQIGATRYSIGVWKNGRCYKGKIQDKLAREVAAADDKDPSFIPAVDGNK